MKGMEGLVICEANYIPLSPISILERARFVYQDQLSIVYGTKKYSWKETHERCVKLASALSQIGVTPGNIVSSSLFNFLCWPQNPVKLCYVKCLVRLRYLVGLLAPHLLKCIYLLTRGICHMQWDSSRWIGGM